MFKAIVKRVREARKLCVECGKYEQALNTPLCITCLIRARMRGEAV